MTREARDDAPREAVAAPPLVIPAKSGNPGPERTGPRRPASSRRHRPFVPMEAGSGIGPPPSVIPAKAGIQGRKGRVLGVRLEPTQALRPHGSRKRDRRPPLRHSRESGNPGRARTGPRRPASSRRHRPFVPMEAGSGIAPPFRHSRESGNPGPERTGPWRPPRADTGPSSPRKQEAGSPPPSVIPAKEHVKKSRHVRVGVGSDKGACDDGPREAGGRGGYAQGLVPSRHGFPLSSV